MKRAIGCTLVMLMTGGCMSKGDKGPYWAHAKAATGADCCPSGGVVLENLVGPWGQPVTSIAHGSHSKHPTSSAVAHQPEQGPAPVDYSNVDPATVSTTRTQVRFVGPRSARVGWYSPDTGYTPEGNSMMIAQQLELPGRYNLQQASVYRLRLSGIPTRPGLVLYPTLEVVPANPKTDPFLAHNYVPVEFTEEDFDQVTTGNYVTKVIYLPVAKSKNPSGSGPAEIVSSRLDPNVDPIDEAHRRGNILVIVRLGGINLEGGSNSAVIDVVPFQTSSSIIPELGFVGR